MACCDSVKLTAEEPDLKRQKLEEEVNLKSSSSEEEIEEINQVNSSSSTFLIDYIYSSDDENNFKYEDGTHEITKKEFIKYIEQVNASEGFDVDNFPKTVSFGMIVPVYDPPRFNGAGFKENIFKHTANAIVKYNIVNTSAYEFVSVVKANMEPVSGLMFYITYKAKLPDENDAAAKMFQAKVWDGVEEVKILFVRLKPTPGASN